MGQPENEQMNITKYLVHDKVVMYLIAPLVMLAAGLFILYGIYCHPIYKKLHRYVQNEVRPLFKRS